MHMYYAIRKCIRNVEHEMFMEYEGTHVYVTSNVELHVRYTCVHEMFMEYGT